MSVESAFEPFSAVKGVSKVLGILSSKKKSFGVFINICLVFLQLALILPCFAYFIRYLSDVNVAAEVLSVLFPATLHLGQYFILIFTKPKLGFVFDQFEELIRRSMYG